MQSSEIQLFQTVVLSKWLLINCKTDPIAQYQRTIVMSNDIHTAKKPHALDRVVKLIEVLIQSPHLEFGIIVWAYVDWFLLAL